MSRLGSVTLTAVKDENKDTYTPREFLNDVQEFVFKPTRQGKTLSVSEKKLQMKLLANIMLFLGRGEERNLGWTRSRSFPVAGSWMSRKW